MVHFVISNMYIFYGLPWIKCVWDSSAPICNWFVVWYCKKAQRPTDWQRKLGSAGRTQKRGESRTVDGDLFFQVSGYSGCCRSSHSSDFKTDVLI